MIEIPFGTSMQQAEKIIILSTLELNKGNRTKTADQLKISIRSLRNKLWIYGVKFTSYHEPSLEP